MALVNARVLTELGFIDSLSLEICDGEIAALSAREPKFPDFDEIVDLGGGMLIPGFCDIQVNGGGGILFNQDPSIEAVRAIARVHQQLGTTSLTPTLISDDLEKVAEAIAVVDEAVADETPGVAGIHIEGPFLNPDKKGVHDATKLCRLSSSILELLTSARHAQVVVTLAPELADRNQITFLVENGVRVCAGHTNATYEEMKAALDAGVCGFTHLFNAMSPLQSREPGVIAAALESPAWCGIIVDGHHVHPAMLRLAIRAKVDRRFMLVTDAMPAVGTENDHFFIGEQRITVRDGLCLAEDGTLAGSCLTMIDALKNAVTLLGLDLAEASQMASANPAAFLGADAKFGTISVGKRADVIHISDDYDVHNTWIGGNPSPMERVLADSPSD